VAAVYPGTVATIAANKADTSAAPTDHPGHHNQLAEELVATQTELGTDPSGTYATVRERLESTDFKDSVRAATTVNGALATAYANTQVIDGVTLATGNRILIKNQTTGAENGIYTVNATGAPTRALDANTSAKVSTGLIVNVEEGTTQADSIWMLTPNGTIVLDTTALVFNRVDMVQSPWIPMFTSHVNLTAAAAGTYLGHNDITEDVLLAGTASGYQMTMQYVDPADYAIGGRVMQMRVVAGYIQNATANAGTSVCTAGLYPVVPAGGTTVMVPTLGTVITGSTAAITGGAALQDTRVLSSTFTAPAADTYALCVAVSVATTAGGRKCNLRLEYRLV